ncbi:MAG TPA: Rho termination factor N-terminal domain-containing protein [Nitrospiraceae bacterium]|nr:Rho termination factor N-terminal domain-containing protein [Nitrospiraceae bacterium]
METKTAEHRDSLGQPNPAVDLEKKNIEAANQRTEENAKLPGTPRSRALDQAWATGQGSGGAAPAATEQQKQDYEGMTVPELRELAKERGVEAGWDARKDEIVTALEKDDKKKG